MDSLVDDVIMPIISVFTGGINFDSWNLTLGTGESAPVLGLGQFVAALLNFVIVAFVIFMLVKFLNKTHAVIVKKEKEATPTTKDCPFCFSKIDIKATKCPYCTSEIPKRMPAKK